MASFHTWRCMYEGVGQDSSYGHKESHLMHDMKYSIGLHFYMKCGVMYIGHCMCILVGSFCWKIFLLGIAHPDMRKYFSGTRDTRSRNKSKSSVVKKTGL